MSLLFRRASLASLGLAFGLSALSLSPLMAQETKPAQPDAAAPAAAPVDPNAVVATINGEKLTEADLALAEGELSQQFAQLPPEQRRAAALSAAIEIRVMAKKAIDSGLDKNADFQRRMAFLQQRALHGEVVEKEVVNKVTDADVRARYDHEIANTPPVNEVHARHILVKTKEEAEAIIKQLDGGADFQKLANEHTSDPSGKSNGGDLGWFGPGQMVPEFDKAAFALDVGKYSKEPVQSQFGWHVIKVEDKRAKQPPAFDDVKDQAKQAVIRDKYFAMVKELRGAAKVEIPDAKLKAAVDTMENGK
ncbi:peptidylprolyl isomerase [Mesorhizobium sp. M1C.F.Ca.ET.193.01.1.1]|uniref:peptidylprolyl isomerase n=1 Tax=unclassified Mesorhizobium TaxID=325217 RepID=UPI000FD54DFA|nr:MULTISPECIES: peptidylprolyl isomerase [unclassified Mesorhizobium]TGT04862.1 peptidylprolyl isomerase [bacterium M00.F.Ca.ET.177.01.1.1]TGQ57690.1 peptidylprolyl isomerase [Mesorhizobium sp. M1C.F.Ca.ET.210.01.1.1]TGQ76146.1 peptidylprolyl isomerase [Mesorhizobium sp. M1C.F.Ca.ET.212.01.1.1]TGR14532.1 peptidylprolyl isomerase [Mesorhizobium sp. M1C.F.Ca.ET.204.01.1.1]TGR35695.1 peptidylprolyl isomerase [Mesorhizobium sp. M1C.F.Ca.ET.196.01.1.1]